MKLNMKNFKFEETTAKVNEKYLKEYEDYKKVPAKERNDYQKEFIAHFKSMLKNPPRVVLCTHIPTGIYKQKKLEGKETNDVFAEEVAKMVKEKRTAKQQELASMGTNKTFDGAKYKLVGGVFTTPGEIIKIGNSTNSNDPLKKKEPKFDKINYIGVELEFNNNVAGLNNTRVGDILRGAGFAKYIHSDVDNTAGEREGTSGIEVKVLLPENDFEEKLTKIMNIIKNLGFKVNERCGTHVHLDMRNRDVAQCYENLFKVQTLFKKFLTKERITNKNCKANKQPTFDEHEDATAFCPTLKKPDKYYIINTKSYKEHRTLEIRAHQGTLEASKLIPWIKLLLKVVNNPKPIEKRVLHLRQAKEEFNIDPKSYKEMRNCLTTIDT